MKVPKPRSKTKDKPHEHSVTFHPGSLLAYCLALDHKHGGSLLGGQIKLFKLDLAEHLLKRVSVKLNLS